MIFKGRKVTLNNYKEIFGICTPDILDEIRSAILDDTPIVSYIDKCGDDSYKLGQIRKAIREGVPKKYLSVLITGDTILNIRKAHKRGIDMDALVVYYGKLDEEIIEKLSDFCLFGVDISKVDFTLVPTNLVDLICKGLYKKYPMWLLVEKGCRLDEKSVNALMRGMSLDVDIHPFIDGMWSVDALYLIFSYARSVDLNSVVQYLSYTFEVDLIKELLDLASQGVDISRLASVDQSGEPVYNRYQVYEIGLAIIKGVDTEQMYNPELSDMDISLLREDILNQK